MFFTIFLLVTIQFFWVLAKYETIESGKVFWWTIFYALPLSIIIGLILNTRTTEIVCYCYPEKYNKDNLTKIDLLKNRLITLLLMVAICCFGTYDTIIQTNDWFGKKEYYTFDTKVLSSKRIQHASRRRLGSGNVTYDLTLIYKGKRIVLSSRKPYSEGDEFTKIINIGGFWGILFEE